MGEEKAREIEENPDNFYNLDKFRIWRAKARFNAILSTLVAVPAVSTILNGNRNGIGLMRGNKVVTGVSTVLFYCASYYVFLRKAGFTNEVFMEQTYARNHKMLRNAIIQQ